MGTGESYFHKIKNKIYVKYIYKMKGGQAGIPMGGSKRKQRGGNTLETTNPLKPEGFYEANTGNIEPNTNTESFPGVSTTKSFSGGSKRRYGSKRKSAKHKRRSSKRRGTTKRKY